LTGRMSDGNVPMEQSGAVVRIPMDARLHQLVSIRAGFAIWATLLTAHAHAHTQHSFDGHILLGCIL